MGPRTIARGNRKEYTDVTVRTHRFNGAAHNCARKLYSLRRSESSMTVLQWAECVNGFEATEFWKSYAAASGSLM
jgi:hypothetical protein